MKNRKNNDTKHNNRKGTRRTAMVVGALAASSLAVGISATSASAMSISQWRAACINSGGEWDAYRSYGVMNYECLWVTGSGYSVDTYRGGRFVRTCGGNFSREVCIDI
jgi:hypothetical protein